MPPTASAVFRCRGDDARNDKLGEGAGTASGVGRILPAQDKESLGVTGLTQIRNQLPAPLTPLPPTNLEKQRGKGKDTIVAEGGICK